MTAARRPRLAILGTVLLCSCAQLGEQRFAEFLPRFQSDSAFRANALGERLWVTETTLWQDPDGYDRSVSCSSVRSLEWFRARGYRLLPTPEEAEREDMVLTASHPSRVTAAVTLGPARAEPQAVYSFYREGGEWQLSGVELIRRQDIGDGSDRGCDFDATGP